MMNDPQPPLSPLPSHDGIAKKIAKRYANKKSQGKQLPDSCSLEKDDGEVFMFNRAFEGDDDG